MNLNRLATGLIASICLQAGCATKGDLPKVEPSPKSTAVTTTSTPRPKNRYGFNRVLDYGTTKVDLGELVGTEVVEHSLNVKNTGAETVVLNNISTSCGCCQAMLSSFEIPPGGECKLDITLDPAKASERFSVLVSVEYMDREEVDRVQVVGQVVK